VTALAGTRVIELADAHGEWCGKLFADMGADVVKIEPPGGAPTRRVGPFVGDEPHRDRSLYFWHCNTSKRGVTLDAGREDGRRLMRRLVQGADVFISTLAAAEAGGLGLDHASLAALNPRLIHVSITPFGLDGPYVEAGFQTTDLVSMALGGPMQSCGYDPGDGLPPVRPGPDHSYHTASHYAFIGALAALWEREESGRGQLVEVSAQAALAVTVEFANTYWEYDRALLRRQTGRHASWLPSGTARTQYLAADGRYVNLALPTNQAAWEKLLSFLRERGLGEGLDEDALRDPQRRMAMGGALYGLLEVLTANLPSEELFHLGQALGLTWAPVRAPEDWLEDPHAAARGFIVEVEHPELGRSVRYPGAPYRFTRSPWRLRRRAPLLGEDNESVYGELGLSRADLCLLAGAGVI
jgi:crotonobetainyl-CoA:carnitine CoA-transferase CaiB-like acyl-CoA transferase